MLLTVLAIWLGLAVPAAVLVAAVGRSALREDEDLGHLPTPVVDARAATTGAPASASTQGSTPMSRSSSTTC